MIHRQVITTRAFGLEKLRLAPIPVCAQCTERALLSMGFSSLELQQARWLALYTQE